MESVSIPVPHKVPFRQGATWIQHAFFLVREQPLTWLLFAAMYGMIQLTVAALPAAMAALFWLNRLLPAEMAQRAAADSSTSTRRTTLSPAGITSTR